MNISKSKLKIDAELGELTQNREAQHRPQLMRSRGGLCLSTKKNSNKLSGGQSLIDVSIMWKRNERHSVNLEILLR